MEQKRKQKGKEKCFYWKQAIAFIMLVTLLFTQQGIPEVFASNNLEETVSGNDVSNTEIKENQSEHNDNENAEENKEYSNTENKDSTNNINNTTEEAEKKNDITEGTDNKKENDITTEEKESENTEETDDKKENDITTEEKESENIEKTDDKELQNTQEGESGKTEDIDKQEKDEGSTEEEEQEESGSEADESGNDEKITGIVTGFTGYDGFQPLYCYEVEYGCPLEELPLPQEITANVLMQKDNSQEIITTLVPITWNCVDDSMGGSTYLPQHENRSALYTFVAELEEGYVLQEGMNPVWDMPYVTVSYSVEKKEGTKETQETLTLDVTFPSKYYNSETKVLELYYNSATQISTTITGTTVTEPILKIFVPEKMNLTYYPTDTDETLGPNLAETDAVTMTKENGIVTLTYRFKEKVAQTGFNITVEPVYQLTDGKEYEIKAQYYDGETILKEESTTFTVDNPTVKKGTLYPAVDFKDIKEYSLTKEDGIYDVPINKGFSSGTTDHYPYEKATVTVLIPSEGVPGRGQGDNFTALEEGVTWTSEKGWKVTYYKNQSYSNEAGTISGTSDMLVYEPSEKFLKGKSVESFNDEIYLRFTNPQAGTISTNITPKIVITADGKASCVYDHQNANYYRCYGITFKEYNIKDYFYITSAAASSSSITDQSYIIKGYESSYKSRIHNKTGEVMRDVKVSYTFDEKIWVPKIQLNLKNADSVCPAKAQIAYKTKNNGETIVYKELTADENALSLVEDSFTYIEVIYDKIGKTDNYYNNYFLTASLYHYEEEPDAKAHKITAQLVSAVGDSTGACVTTQEEVELTYYLKSSEKLYFFRRIKNITTGAESNVALNKGDSFCVKVYSNGKGYVKNLGIYLLMPKGYIFKGYTAPDNFEEGEYTVTSVEVGNGKILYGVKYTDDADYPVSNANHEFQFIVGPEVNTSQVQTDVKLPQDIYISSEHETFLLYTKNKNESAILDKDDDGTADTAWDINGDGDTEDSFYGLSWTPDITINSVVALTTQSFLSSSRQSGEDVNREYEFDSKGTYKFYIFNGFQSGQTLEGAEIEIPIPRKGDTITWQGETYTSQWDVKITGPVSATGEFLTGAEITYSTDGSTYTTEVEDYSKVRSIKVKTATDKTLASEETAIVQVPFKTAFHEEMQAGKTYHAYWETRMKYETASETEVVANIQPSTLTAVGKTLSGTIYQDHNGNGTQEETETGNGKSYTWKLYPQEGTNGDYLTKGSTNSSNGKYVVEILVPGTYTLKIEKESLEYYVPNSYFNADGCYTFTVTEDGNTTAWKNMDLGILSPRTVKTNFTSVTLNEGGDTRNIVPTITPALMTGEEGVSFNSNDTSVVTVGDDGKLTVTGEGSTTVTVKVPQLQALVSQGADPYIRQEVAVTCQLAGCHMKAKPSLKTSTASTAADMGEEGYIQLSSSGSKTQNFYYFYGNEGYCNEDSHDSTNGVTAEVVSQGNTDAAITAYTAGTSYRRFQLKVSKPGVVKIKFQREWEHEQEEKPQDREVTIYVLPYQLESPQIVIEPETCDGENGWYKSLPEISIITNADTAYTDTWISTDGETYKVLDEDNQPVIAQAGTYTFALYNKVRAEGVDKESLVVTSVVKVDNVKPVITDVRIGEKEAVISLKDKESGIAKLDYMLSGGEYQSVNLTNEQAVVPLPSSTEDVLIFCPTDIAGNAGSVRKIKNIAGYWLLEDGTPFLYKEAEVLEENELKAAVLIINTGSGIAKENIVLTQSDAILSADSYTIEETEHGYVVKVLTHGITVDEPIVVKVIDNLGQENSIEVISEFPVYTVSYDGGEGAQGQTPESVEVVEGQKYVLENNPYTKDGWTFCGWCYGNKLYQPGQKITIAAESIVFKALWEKSESKSAKVLALEAAIRYLPEVEDTDDVILASVQDICDAKERYEALEIWEQKQVESPLKEKLAKLMARLMTVKTEIETQIKAEASNLNEIARLLNLTENVTDENLHTPYEEVNITVTMKLDKKETDEAIPGKEEIIRQNPMKEIEFYNISLFKEITKKVSGVTTTESGEIKEIPKELEISMELSQSSRQGSNHKVVRYHEGNVEELILVREKDNIIFHTDKFSTYAIVYDPYIPLKDSGNTWENNLGGQNETQDERVINIIMAESKKEEDRGELDAVPKTGEK